MPLSRQKNVRYLKEMTALCASVKMFVLYHQYRIPVGDKLHDIGDNVVLDSTRCEREFYTQYSFTVYQN